jgi:cephalosporin hydroxylase
MKEDKKHTFQITKESLSKLEYISQNMENKTFHKHTHILYDIRTELGESPITYLEIGSYAGGSISLMSSHDYPTNCYSLDLGSPISPDVVERNVSKFKNEKSTFKYFQGNSQDSSIINLVNSQIKEVDILFIDGDHSRSGVFNDFKNYSELVKKGGYIAFDDYLDYQYSPEVRDAVDTIVSNLSNDEYDVIGSLKYEILKEYTHMDGNNIFIIKKK